MQLTVVLDDITVYAPRRIICKYN